MRQVINREDATKADAERTLASCYMEVGRCRLTPGCPRVDLTGCQRLKLTCDEPLSNSAFNFNLCRYMEGNGVEADMVQAAFWCHRAAPQGRVSSVCM